MQTEEGGGGGDSSSDYNADDSEKDTKRTQATAKVKELETQNHTESDQ